MTSSATIPQILISLLFALAVGTPLGAQSFSPQDRLLILVTGLPDSSTAFGYSGKASLFQSIATEADGTIRFVPVKNAQGVDVERNSATDFTNKANYGTNGFIPPGIYFLHYHRLDPNKFRHRLGLSDLPGEETIQSTIPDPAVLRTGLQFHRAYNDLKEYKANVSEGCITLSAANFARLFPDSFFAPATTPLATGTADEKVGLTGSTTNILVFITDVMTAGRQKDQVALFEKKRKMLKPSDFGVEAGSQLPALRVLWK